MASNVYKAQKAIDLCNDHSNKKLTLFCKSCKKQICTDCVEAGHIGHEWDVLNAVANERRACLPKVCQDIRRKSLPSLKTLMSGKATDDDNDDILQQLEKKRKVITETTNKLIDEQKEKYKTLKGRGSFQEYEIKEMLNYMDTITTSLDVNVHTYSDSDVMVMEQEMMSTLAKLESLKIEKEKVPALFMPGHFDYTILSKMIGEVISQDQKTQSTVDVTETHTVGVISTYVISPVQNGRAWIRDSVDSKVKLFDKHGNTIQTMLYSCNDFTFMDNGDHVLTDRESKQVRVTSPDGSQRLVCDTKPLIPTLVSKTCDGDLLISMRNENDKYTITPSSRRLVQRMNMVGDVMRTYEFLEDGESRLFTLAARTAENRNGDVCAINLTSNFSGELIILLRDGRVRATYRGHEYSAETFYPVDVACDSRCRIIVSDPPNFSVHLLSYDGVFLRYLLSGLGGRPECVSLNDDSLWLSLVSVSSNKVKVYRYK